MKNTIILNKSITDENTKLGYVIRKRLDELGIFSINIMASPGAGKTSFITKTIEHLKDKYHIAVIEGDIVPIDVVKIQKLGVPVVLAHTGGACHLDSVMMEKSLGKLDLTKINLLIVENVGNLICPADFYLGTRKNVVIASIPEGADKPYKYPAIFQKADVVILNKSDYIDSESFDVDYFIAGVRLLNRNADIFMTSCKTGNGINAWKDWLEKEMKKL
jgi:hydrogenase nickel incorporation protein HypB